MPVHHTKESKICPVCTRVFYNRKKWSQRGLWASIIYCSDQCRKKKGKK